MKRWLLIFFIVAVGGVASTCDEAFFPIDADEYGLIDNDGILEINFESEAWFLRSLQCHQDGENCEYQVNGNRFTYGNEDCQENDNWNFCAYQVTTGQGQRRPENCGDAGSEFNNVMPFINADVTCSTIHLARREAQCTVRFRSVDFLYQHRTGSQPYRTAIIAMQPTCDARGGGPELHMPWISPPLDLRDATTSEEFDTYTFTVIERPSDDDDDSSDASGGGGSGGSPGGDDEDDESDSDADELGGDEVESSVSFDSDDDGVPDRLDAYPGEEEIWDGARPRDGIEDGRYTGPAIVEASRSESVIDTSDPNGDPDDDNFPTRIDLCPALAGDVDGCPVGYDAEEGNDAIPDGNDDVDDSTADDFGTGGGGGCQLAVSASELHPVAIVTIFLNLLTVLAFRRKLMK